MDEEEERKSFHWVFLLLGTILLVAVILARLQIIPRKSGQSELAPPTGSIPTQLFLLTEIAKTLEVAQLTPKTTLPAASPVTGQDSTPDYSTVPHIYIENSVIIDQGASDSLALCFRGETGVLPWVRNQWIPLDHPPYPYLVVYAGGIGEERPPTQGAIFIWDIKVDRDPCALEAILTPIADGPVEIISVQGNELLLRSLTSGGTWTFNTDTREFISENFTPIPGLSPPSEPSATPSSSL